MNTPQPMGPNLIFKIAFFMIGLLIDVDAQQLQKLQDTKSSISVDFDLIQNISMKHGDGTKQISDINVLLPIQTCKDCPRAYKQITATNGCYNWKLSHPKLVDLQTFPSKSHPNCANVIEVSNLQNKESKTLVWLTAKDQSTQTILSSQIKVAFIQKIEIFSRFRLVNNGDRAHIEVRAYDDEGNVFSSLDGFRFKWNVESGEENIMRVPLRDNSHQKAYGHAHLDEDKWTQGDDFILRALKSGQTKITVSLLEQGYENINPASITLTIIDPFIIQPTSDSTHEDFLMNLQAQKPPILLVPKSPFQLKVSNYFKDAENQIYHKDVSSGDPGYLWEMLSQQDQTESSISQKGLFNSDQLGSFEISVLETKFQKSRAEIDIQVVVPNELNMLIKDVSNKNIDPKNGEADAKSLQKQLGVEDWDDKWIMVEGNQYLVSLELQDKEGLPITLTPNLQFESIFNSTFFEVISSNLMKNEILVRVKDNDLVNNNAVKSIVTSKLLGDYKVTGQREAILTSRVEIIHPTDLIILPPQQVQNLMAKGGSGTYRWSIMNEHIGQVLEKAQVQSETIGVTKLRVQDDLNANNFAFINFEVAEVHHLEWLEQRVEALKGNEVLLSTIAVDQQGRKFTNCTDLTIVYQISGDGFVAKKISDQISINTWDSIKKGIKSKMQTIVLKERFNQETDTKYASLLVKKAPVLDDEILFHNNYGVCSQFKMVANQEGPSRVKAYIKGFKGSIQSENAEAASYKELEVLSPSYAEFHKDLHSKDQSDQDQQNMDKLVPKTPNYFVVSQGSSFKTEIQGGQNIFENFLDDYEQTWKVNNINGTKENRLSITSINQHQSLHKIEIKCQNIQNDMSQTNFEYEVEYNLKGKVSNVLLNPKSTSITLRINCRHPIQNKLFWSQESTQSSPLVQFPYSKTIKAEKIFYALTGSTHYLRLMQLDSLGHTSLNHSSFNTVYSTDNGELGQLYETNYDKRKLVVGEKTGTLVIDAVTNAYKKGYFTLNKEVKAEKKKGSIWSTFGGSKEEDKKQEKQMDDVLPISKAIKDTLKIEIVKNINVYPSYKSLFFNGGKNQFKIQIRDGSGDYNIALNSSIATYKQSGRELTIVPVETGTLKVSIEDALLPESPIVEAIILISDVERLDLDSQNTLIEQTSSTVMNVTVFDSVLKEFDADQVQKMKFNLDFKSQGVMRKDGLKIKEENRLFNVTGIDAGKYVVTATLQQSEEPDADRISSRAISLEVFNLLELQPQNLLLTPGMRYTLKPKGGLQDNHPGTTVDIKMQNKSIAVIDESKEIKALLVGDTQLIYTIYHQNQIVAQKTLAIRVHLITSIEVPQQSDRVVYTNSMLKQIAVMKYLNETFSFGISPVSFDWECSQPSILTPHRPSENQQQVVGFSDAQSKKIRDNLADNDNAIFVSTFNSSSVYTKAMKEGDAVLNVLMAISYPDEYKREQNWFRTNVTVKVQDRLSVMVPEYINGVDDSHQMTHLLMIPPNTYLNIPTNKKTELRMAYSKERTSSNEYKDTDEPIIEFQSGKQTIKALERYGKATLIMEEENQHAQQVVMLNIFITDIFQISALNFYESLVLPVGSSMNIPLKFQNEHAHLFAMNIQGIKVGFELSHPRVVSAEFEEESHSLNLKSKGSGECMVLIYLEGHKNTIYDTFKVTVATIVEPSPSGTGEPVMLHLGSAAKFTLIDHQREDVGWYSSNNKVLQIDSQTGHSIAMNEGEAQISLSNEISAASAVQVSRISSATLDEQEKDLVINLDDQSDLNVRVKLYLRNSNQQLMPMTQYNGQQIIEQNVQFKCVSENPNYVDAVGVQNDFDGFYCRIKDTGVELQKETPRKVGISVIVGAKSQSGDKMIYETKLARFEVMQTSQILIENKFKNGIDLSLEKSTQIVKVLSLADFSVHANNDNIKVSTSRESHASNQYNITIQVQKKNKLQAFSSQIEIRPLNDQGIVQQIPIRFKPKQKGIKTQDLQAPKFESNNKTANVKRVEEKRSGNTDESKSKKSGSIQGYVFIFVIFAVLFVLILDSNLTLGTTVQQLFQNCFKTHRGTDASDVMSSRNFFSMGGSQNSFNAGVRDNRRNMFASPVNKGANRPYQRNRVHHGSVTSPNSIYGRVPESIYQGDNF